LFFYGEGDSRAQLVWHASCVEPQVAVQVWVAVGFKIGLAGVVVGAPSVVVGAGMKQVVRQFAACELHVIMQLVTVEVIGVGSPGVAGDTCCVPAVCASRINSSAQA
jgi:hypothetical protein